MKRFLSVVLATLMVLALVSFARTEEARAEPEIWDGTIATGYAGGDGSKDSPYLIANGAQLAYLAQQTNSSLTYSTGKYFKLTADIVLNDASNRQSWGSLDDNDEVIAPANAWTPIGAGSYFSGNFDGNYKTVSGVYINGGGNLGLFGACYGATIQSVGVAESFISGSFSVGGVVGSTHFNSTVTNCFNAGTVSGTGNQIGGVVGNHSVSNITNCFNSGTVSGDRYVGGVVGNNAGSIANCYNSGTVSGNDRVGGVVGWNSDSISTCYNAGNIISEGTVVGGVVGLNGGATVTNCYYLDTCGASAGIGESEGGTVDNVISLTDLQLKDESYYGGFDFDNIWTMTGNPDYPYAEIRGWYPIPVTGITATESIELGIGGTKAIEYTITPSDADNLNVSFTSSAESVATVSDTGVVTGVAAGTATITTTTEDGAFTDTTTVIVHADCTVTYLADNVQVAQYQVHWGNTLETIPDVPAKEGHDQVAPAWDIDLTDVAIEKDYTVNAVYTINTYTVTYVADGETVAQYTVRWGDTLETIPEIPAKEGYDQVAPTWSVDLTDVAIKQDYTVNAVYTINTYTVTYVADGETVALYRVNHNETLGKIPAVPTKVGYDQVEPEWSVDLKDVPITQDYTVTAVYTINTYTVTYMADGEQIAQYTVNWKDTLSEIPTVPAKEGHDQVAPKWCVDLEGVEIKLNYTVNAVYTINTYTVTYIVDGETLESYTVNWNETLTEIPEVPTKPHHITIGWDKDLLNLAIKQDYEVTAQYIALLYGDANCDNEVDANDASLILRHVVGLSNISELGCIQGDVTPRYDHIPNSADAAAILRLIVKLIPTFPIQTGN
ncbi:MAG: InlB B-repeat-containing protein [Clostridia bacterium]|nr:InlB B-repeat-containing protein [Clostridia bacterium]